MKKLWIIKLMMLFLYCIPFAFLAINGDANSGTMSFYGLMIVSFILLCWIALKTRNISIIFIGNILSSVSSYVIAKLSGLKPLGEYFKPFTSYNLIIAVSVVSILIHTIIVLIYLSKCKTKDIK